MITDFSFHVFFSKNYFGEKIGVFATNSDILISISVQTNLLDLIDISYNSVRSNYLSLKYQRFTLSGSKDIGIKKFEFVAKKKLSGST